MLRGDTESKRDGAVRPWLSKLAQAQIDRPDRVLQVYDRRTQMTHLGAPGLTAAIDSDKAPTTKKADRETGEDQKGF